jgi:1-acyl-sn-glycerol-3-phosphate acyltransferase
MAGHAVFPKKLIFTSIPDNLRLPLAGLLVNILGSVPVPSTVSQAGIFMQELSKQLRRGRFVHLFPEGELVENDCVLRTFEKGAFQLAIDALVPVIPIGITIKKQRTGLLRYLFPRHITVRIGPPVYPDPNLRRNQAVELLMKKTIEEMKKTLSDSC